MASCEFSSKYMVLRPDKAGPLYLLRFIFWGFTAEGEEAFIQIKGDEENLKRNLLIALSLLGQMILLWVCTPLKKIGLVFEGFLNLVSTKRNLLRIFLDLLQG